MAESGIHIKVTPEVTRVWKAFSPLVCSLLPLSIESFECSLSNEELITGLRQGITPEIEFSGEIGDWPDNEPSQLDLLPRDPKSSGQFQQQIIVDISMKGLCGEVKSGDDAIAFKAGLLQFHDDLSVSHNASVSIEGKGTHRAGDYWHAIMHRREPDYSNSKYWFRNVGQHPIFPLLGEYCGRLSSQTDDAEIADWSTRLQQGRQGWNPMTFVDLCQSAARTQGILRTFAEQLQRREMWLLLESNWQDLK